MDQLTWHPHPDVWLLIGSLAFGYAYALRRIGPRLVHPVERTASRAQVACFSAGLLVLWIASDWPLHELAEGYLYSMHMVQHLLFSLVAPPLLLLGTPDWLVRWLLRPVSLLRAVRFLTRPLVALVLFNAVIALTHVPQVVDLSTRSEPFHFLAHAVLFGSALCMWSPVLNRLIELPTLSYPGRLVYLFLQSLVPTVPASFLTFGDDVLYRFYETTPRLSWLYLTPITDQRVAGLIMKLAGGAILWVFIIVYFLKWFQVEDREGVDVLGLRSVERDVEKAELTER